MGKITSKGDQVGAQGRVANISEFMNERMTDGRISSAAAGGASLLGQIPFRNTILLKWIGQACINWFRKGMPNGTGTMGVHRSSMCSAPIGFHLEKLTPVLTCQHGTIESIKFYGDFLGNGEMADLEAALTGVRYDADALLTALARIDVNEYFGGITPKEFAQFLYG